MSQIRGRSRECVRVDGWRATKIRLFFFGARGRPPFCAFLLITGLSLGVTIFVSLAPAVRGVCDAAEKRMSDG